MSEENIRRKVAATLYHLLDNEAEDAADKELIYDLLTTIDQDGIYDPGAPEPETEDAIAVAGEAEECPVFNPNKPDPLYKDKLAAYQATKAYRARMATFRARRYLKL